jgi:glycosyltransferase involved in cell wall biosynthesis
VFSKFSFSSQEKPTSKKPPVSIIITCKNEAKNLKQNLFHFIKQDYPIFEIILVDDASTDATLSIIKDFKKKYELINYLSIPASNTYQGNKKNAVTQGIAIAKYENLLFTDADCIPNTNNWIFEMSSHFSDQKQLLLGYGAYKKTTAWLNKLIRYETVLTAWQYFSYAQYGMAYMGVGRNMGYTKSLFNEVSGFSSHRDLLSGVDDLLVNQAAKNDNIALIWNPESHSISQPKTNLKEWLHQKRRHITTASHYKKIHQFLLGLFFISQLAFFSLIPLLLYRGKSLKTIGLLIVLRYLVYYISLVPTLKKLKETDLIFWAVFLELFLIVLQMRIFITNLVAKPDKW